MFYQIATANRKLDQYKGRLSAKQIAEGMNAAGRNSMRLVEDADLLLEEKRFSSAASLAILAIEESGKLSILRSMSVARNDKDLKESWSDYRSHTRKNVAWIVPDLVRAGCWQTGTPYDESTYLNALKRRGSPLLNSIMEAT